jgi:hypothetical protein
MKWQRLSANLATLNLSANYFSQGTFPFPSVPYKRGKEVVDVEAVINISGPCVIGVSASTVVIPHRGQLVPNT